MRLTVAVVVVAVLAGSAAAQLNVGPQGLSAPPINVLAVFRFLRDVVSQIMPDNALPVENKETLPGIIDALSKVGRTCPLGETCWPWLTDDDDDDDDGDGEDDEEDDIVDVLESKFVVTKWIMAYVGIIITCSVLILVIGFPYLITGQTFRSLDTSSLPFPDRQDSMLLLTWLLGETSGDESCLERVVCLNPERSARYLALPNAFSTLLSRWTSLRHQDQLRRLVDVTGNGLHHSCDQYACPVLPDL